MEKAKIENEKWNKTWDGANAVFEGIILSIFDPANIEAKYIGGRVGERGEGDQFM